MKRIEIKPDLYLIPLAQPLPGFASFISAWLYTGGRTVLVDPGPSSSVGMLCEALKSLNVQRLDAILLTHIHIDHAGGAGDLSLQFPDTPVICHNAGIEHLAAPAKLWEGSLKTLGKTAQAYGPIRPVPQSLLKDAAEFHDFGVLPIPTPGHASHHVSYRIDDYLFGGEAGGVSIPIDGALITDSKDGLYLRPATPPRFFLETHVKSIDRLIDVPHRLFCFGHFGATEDTPTLLKYHRTQILNWLAIIQEQKQLHAGSDLISACVHELLKTDPLLAGWNRLEGSVQDREFGFLQNAVKGFLGYIESQNAPS